MFFFDGRGQFFATRAHALAPDEGFFLGGVPLQHLTFSSSGTRNAIYLDFAFSVPTGSDRAVNFFDVSPFIELLTTGRYRLRADINEDGEVSFVDIGPFIELLGGQ